MQLKIKFQIKPQLNPFNLFNLWQKRTAFDFSNRKDTKAQSPQRFIDFYVKNPRQSAQIRVIRVPNLTVKSPHTIKNQVSN